MFQLNVNTNTEIVTCNLFDRRLNTVPIPAGYQLIQCYPPTTLYRYAKFIILLAFQAAPYSWPYVNSTRGARRTVLIYTIVRTNVLIYQIRWLTVDMCKMCKMCKIYTMGFKEVTWGIIAWKQVVLTINIMSTSWYFLLQMCYLACYTGTEVWKIYSYVKKTSKKMLCVININWTSAYALNWKMTRSSATAMKFSL